MKIMRQLFNGYPGILIMPDDYLTGEPMALEVYDAGVGEQKSNGTLANVDLLYANGCSLAMARDGLLNNVADPITGKSCRYAVVALQGAGWAVDPNVIETVVVDIIKTYKIDPALVMKTGLSAGGANTFLAIGINKTNLYKVAVPMSAAGITIELVNSWKDCNTKVLAFHGTLDGTCPIDNSIRYVDGINAAHPGNARLIKEAYGHEPAAWSKWFSNSYIFDVGGYKVNIHQLPLLFRSKPDLLFTTVINPPVMSLQAIGKISIVNGTGTFDPTASTGAITAFRWDNNGSVTWDKGARDGGVPAIKNATGFLPNSNYVLTLTVWDKYGAKNDMTYNILTDATASGNNTGVVIPPSTKTVVSIITTTVYKDAAGVITTDTVVK